MALSPSMDAESSTPSVLRVIRTRLNLSQAECAAALGVAVETFRTWDAGRRTPPAAAIRRAETLTVKFRLTTSEKSELVANCDHLARLKFAKTLPHAFTERGAITAASVLNSRRAVEVAVFVVRAFVKIRRVLSEDRELAHRLVQLEGKLAEHDEQIVEVIRAIRTLLGSGPVPQRWRIGFNVKGEP
jgi:transcriptional regulator with XRE-family HTH domain